MMRYNYLVLTAILGFVPSTHAIEKAAISMDLIELLGELDTESLDEEAFNTREQTSMKSKMNNINQAPNDNTKRKQSQQSAAGGQ